MQTLNGLKDNEGLDVYVEISIESNYNLI